MGFPEQVVRDGDQSGLQGFELRGHGDAAVKFLQLPKQAVRKFFAEHDFLDFARVRGGLQHRAGDDAHRLSHLGQGVRGQRENVQDQAKIVLQLQKLAAAAVLQDGVPQPCVVVVGVKLAAQLHVRLVQVGKIPVHQETVDVVGLDDLGKEGEMVKFHGKPPF